MRTYLDVNDALMREAKKLEKDKTPSEIATAALQEYVQRRKQPQIFSIFGTIDYEANYDYKRERSAKRSGKRGPSARRFRGRAEG
jgi:hypothetical protein